jgi:anti-sigma-K factor RskA
MTERESMSGTPDCGGDAAAYVLGALGPEEVEAFRAHMLECAVCRDEVAALGGVVQALPMAAHQYEAPRGLRHRVLREVRSGPPVASRPAVLRRPTWRGRPLIAGAAAVVIAAAAVVTSIALTAGPGPRVIPAQVAGITGSAELRVSGVHAELIVRHLTPPGHGHVYEVWLQKGRAVPFPASVLFGVNPVGNADVGIPRGIRGVSAVMVTQEPLGGTPRPTRAPVIVARVA